MARKIEQLFRFARVTEATAGARVATLEPAATPAKSQDAGGASVEKASPAGHKSATVHMQHMHLPAKDADAAEPKNAVSKKERRHRRRVKISAPVRIRQVNASEPADYDMTMTVDVSREGLLFETSHGTYARGQQVGIVFPYRPGPGDVVIEQRGLVVRVARASERRYGIAVAFVPGRPDHAVVDSGGRLLAKGAAEAQANSGAAANEARQDAVNALRNESGGASWPRRARFVLIVDTDPDTRGELRRELEREGYMAESIDTPAEAAAVLRHRQPAALICEADPFAKANPSGSEMSGYDLCVMVQKDSRLAGMPVLMTTRSGRPSDFATAHALGATVCVAKPYDASRVAHLVHLLVPAETV